MYSFLKSVMSSVIATKDLLACVCESASFSAADTSDIIAVYLVCGELQVVVVAVAAAAGR